MMEYHKVKKIKALAALPIVMVLLLAAFAVPSTGLVGIAQAKQSGNENNDDDDDKAQENNRKEFSKLFGNSSNDNDDKDRKPKADPQGDSPFVDLDIGDYGFQGKDAFIEVYGTAGGTVGEHDEAIAYVLAIVTKGGEPQTWAIDSHEKQHGDTHTGSEWHAHRVHLTDDPASPGVDANCLNEVDQVTHAMMDGHRVIFENMKSKGKNGVEGVSAKKITSAATVRLLVLVDDPDNPPAGTACIARVMQAYDTADLTKREHND